MLEVLLGEMYSQSSTYMQAHYCVTALLVTVRGLLKLQDVSVFTYKNMRGWQSDYALDCKPGMR